MLPSLLFSESGLRVAIHESFEISPSHSKNCNVNAHHYLKQINVRAERERKGGREKARNETSYLPRRED